MRTLRITVLMLVGVLVLGAAAFAAGVAVREYDAHRAEAPRAVENSATPTDEASPSRAAAPSVAPGQDLVPALRIEAGDQGKQVRELQSRLFQLAWFPERTTGTYDEATVAAVRGFQEKRGLAVTGVVDERTWNRLLKMTKQPTHDQLFNILHPGPAILASGASGDGVRDLQARMKQIQWFFGDVTGEYGGDTAEAVRGFQAKREIPVTGEVDRRTMDWLVSMTSTPTHEELFNIQPEPEKAGTLDPRCTTGRAMCVDKSTNSLRWVVDGQVKLTVDVRFGSEELPTREGAFTVTLKSRDHVSSLYHTSMPLAMFFSGGQAVHYSPDFAANGYNGASHGCVNVRDYDSISWLFDQVSVGDKVIVYWS